MNERRTAAQTAFGRVSFPVFSDENAPKRAAEINAFYEVLRDAALAYAAELNADRSDGIRLLTAEYISVTAGDRITVTYTLTVRRRGRVIGRKQLTHTWEDGLLLPPQKERAGFFRRRIRARTG